MELTYQEARDLICDGDLVAVITPHNWIGKITQFFTRREYTHVGIAIWVDGGLYLAELNGGRNHLTPLSQWEGMDFDVCAMPRGITNIRESIFKWLRLPVDYGYPAFFAIGIKEFFRIKQAVHWRDILVCVGFCVAVYEESGWPKHDRVIALGELVDALEMKFKVRG